MKTPYPLDQPLDMFKVLFPLRWDIVYKARYLKDERIVEKYIRHCLEDIRRSLGLPEFAEQERALRWFIAGNIRKFDGLIGSLQRGWDYSKHPILLRTPRDGRVLTVYGIEAPNRCFLTDGQHRLSTLLGLGVQHLQPRQFGFRRAPKKCRLARAPWRALDTTKVMLENGMMSWSEYLDFAKVAFPAMPDVTTPRQLTAWFADRGRPKYAAVIRFHWGLEWE